MHPPLSAELPAQNVVGRRAVTPQRTQTLCGALDLRRLIDKHPTEAEHVVGNFRKSLRISSHGDIALQLPAITIAGTHMVYPGDSCRKVGLMRRACWLFSRTVPRITEGERPSATSVLMPCFRQYAETAKRMASACGHKQGAHVM